MGGVFDPGRSVLVTGGTGVLGGLVARHLVVEHGVRSVVLVSRRGIEAPGAAGLRSELEGLGARVGVVACDVGDRSQVEGCLLGCRGSFRWRGVVHAAGVLDDGVIGSLSRGASGWCVGAEGGRGVVNLHELTAWFDGGGVRVVFFGCGDGG